MKPILKKMLIAIGFLLCSLGVYAHDFEVDGIYYQLLSEENQVAVTYYGDDESNVPDEYKYTGSVTIPETVTYQGVTYSVTSIGDWAFNGCTGLTEIIIPNSVAEIGSRAFTSCSGLSEITIPNGVTSIGILTFGGCTGLMEVVIPNSVTSIGEGAFGECTALKEITIPNSVTSIGRRVFESCSGLTEITIPNSVNYISERAFCNCVSLTKVVIPNSVTTIGWGAFSYCFGLKEVTIPACVTHIGSDAFGLCTNLTEITIPNSVTSIGERAFYYCTGLTEIIIPNSVTEIGECAFFFCSGLSSIVVKDGNTVYDSRENCNAIIETASNTLIAGCMNTVIPNSVTTIGVGAFGLCSGLTEVVIPNSVTEIGDGAFQSCDGLTEIFIPNSVTSIGDDAFEGCYGLIEMRVETVNPPTIYDGTFRDIDKSIPLYVSVESVEAYRTAEYWSEFTNIVGYTELAEGDKFTVDGIHYQVLPDSGQVAVTYYGDDESNVPEEYKYTGSVVIPEAVTYQGISYSVTSIGVLAFEGCTDLTSITIPNSVISISEYALQLCTGLTEITIPNSVTEIGDYAFTECIGLSEINIPNSVTSIREGVFSGCPGLTEVVIGNSVTSIGGWAFAGCTGLTEITIPNSVTSIGGWAFWDCNNLISIVISESITEIETGVFSQCYALKEVAIPNGVTSIGDDAFYMCYGLTSIVIPNSVTSIGDNAFQACYGLKEITIPNGLTSIGHSAFSSCEGLTEISIPNSVTSIGAEAFQYCASLTEITIPSGVTTIEAQVFASCKGLTEVVIPNSVTSIGYCAFYGCTGLTEIIIPNSVTSIGDDAFDGCTRLTSVVIPNGVTSIGDYAFLNCYDLTEITIPNSVASIGYGAFAWCCLNKIVIPSSVTSIGVGAFFSDYLTSIVVEEGNTVYDSRENCNAIIETATNTLITGCENTVIPNSVTSIGEEAFFYCTGLTEISIPNSVISIESSAFLQCYDLTEITVPSSVTWIGQYAFSDCGSLTSIRIEAVNPPTIYDDTFGEVDKSIPVYVPMESVEAYRTAEYWSEFTNIIGEGTLTYNVTVPEGTPACYIVGDFNEWSTFVPMTQVDDTHYTIAIDNVTKLMSYKYACGTGWDDIEVKADGSERLNRTWNESDVVEAWDALPGEPSANHLQADDVTVAELDGVLSQARVALPIALVNEAAISAVQCDIYLPAGLSIATTESGMDITLSDRAGESHTLMTKALANGAMRIVIMSASAEALTGNEGTLFTLGLLPNENYNTESQIVIRNITMTDTDIVEYTPEQVVVNCRIRQSILGDANRDNKINVTDIVLLAKYILNDYHGDFDALAGDVNQDGKINVSDIVAMANKILSGEGAAGAPTRQEGEKGTLRMDEVQINGENSATASLMLDNSVSYSAFQMDVILPDGVEIAAIERSERISERHQLMWKVQADGRVRILVFAIDNSEIAAHEGALFDMQLRAQSGFTAGELQVIDATFVTRGTTTHHIDDLAVGVSRTSDLTGNHVGNRVYATGRTLVIESSEAQEARITTADGLSQSIALQPGRNEYPMTQQGVYIVTLGNENKKVIVK